MKAEVKKAKIVFQHYMQFQNDVLVIKKPIEADIECTFPTWFVDPITKIESKELKITVSRQGINPAIEEFERCVRNIIDNVVPHSEERRALFGEYFDLERESIVYIRYEEESDDYGPLAPFHG